MCQAKQEYWHLPQFGLLFSQRDIFPGFYILLCSLLNLDFLKMNKKCVSRFISHVLCLAPALTDTWVQVQKARHSVRITQKELEFWDEVDWVGLSLQAEFEQMEGCGGGGLCCERNRRAQDVGWWYLRT